MAGAGRRRDAARRGEEGQEGPASAHSTAGCVFGPVPSRRLGRSLGVDLVPMKTCSYDCLYCQLGRTTCLTVERRAWVPREAVLEELRGKLATRPDWITLSGSGEPTLHAEIGELVRRIKALCDVPVAVLTNGSLLWRPEVREALLEADLVAPSLDAGDAETFKRVNRPHAEVTFERMVEGLKAFRQVFEKTYWLEVVLLEGLTATEVQVERIAALAERIGPDRVQLNTATRPPAEAIARPVPAARLEALAAVFGGTAEVIAEREAPRQEHEHAVRREDLLETVRRRPCTLGGLATGLGLHPNEVAKYVRQLLEAGLVGTERRGGTVYYVAGEGRGPPRREGAGGV